MKLIRRYAHKIIARTPLGGKVRNLRVAKYEGLPLSRSQRVLLSIGLWARPGIRPARIQKFERILLSGSIKPARVWHG